MQGGFYAFNAYVKTPVPRRLQCDRNSRQADATSDDGPHDAALTKALNNNLGLKRQLEEKYSSVRYTGGGAPEYVLGTALMVSGPVTVTSTTSNVEYAQGMLEYVLDFQGGQPAKPPTLGEMVVTPYTYNIVLARTSGYENKDSYADAGGADGDTPGYQRGEEGPHEEEKYPHGEE